MTQHSMKKECFSLSVCTLKIIKYLNTNNKFTDVPNEMSSR